MKCHRKIKKSTSQIVIKNKSISIHNYRSESSNKSTTFSLRPSVSKKVLKTNSNEHKSTMIEKDAKTVPIFNQQQLAKIKD